MSYSIRHQVFVSSTFTDLAEERAEVIQAIWELECIPTGMEAFVASNEGQWEVIQKVIDECDYYVLILGGRYGSLTPDGISYTEKEYRYAKKIGLPVLAFVHANPEEIPAGKSEKDDASRKRLDAFRMEVMAAHPVRRWSSASELGGLVSRSLIREIKVSPRPGWIRNDGSSPIALLERINQLAEENRLLREQAASREENEIDPRLERGDDRVDIWGTRYIRSASGYDDEHWNTDTTWDAIFRDLGPPLINEATELEMQNIIGSFHILDELIDGEEFINNAVAAPECLNEVIIQFRALGFIEKGVKKRGVNDKGRYWRITPRGDRHLVDLLARRKSISEMT